MARNRARWIAATVGILVVMSTLTASMALAAGVDRTGPTTPTNLRVVGVGPYSVSLAWDASKDKSGIGSYHVCCSNVSSQTFPGNVTNATYTAGLQPGRIVILGGPGVVGEAIVGTLDAYVAR